MKISRIIWENRVLINNKNFLNKMQTFSLINGHVFIFIFIVIIVLYIASFWSIIRPSKAMPYNFNPFPKINPIDLPDPIDIGGKCWKSLKTCQTTADCSECGINYECKVIDKNEPDHYINGLKVPKEKPYCLPKNETPVKCNGFSGRWLWSADPEYCSQVAGEGKTQCWKCECIFPGIYGGKDCGEQQVCQNYTNISGESLRPKNKLVANSFAPTNIQGQEWSPQNTSDTDVLRYTPYAQDKFGNPMFNCKCDSTENNIYFTNLPDDPYNCHLDPCYGNLGYNKPGLLCSGEECECKDCGTGLYKPRTGKFKNTCASIETSCGQDSGGYDFGTDQCICNQTQYFPQKCRVDGVVNDDDPSLPICRNSANAFGSQCTNPCEDPNNKCYHDAVCTAVSATESQCDCSTAKDEPSAPFVWGGKRCETECIPSGTRIGVYNYAPLPGGKHIQWEYNVCQCCDKAAHRTKEKGTTADIICEKGGSFATC